MISNRGFNEKFITLYADGAIPQGAIVKISANNTAAVAAAGDKPCGILLGSRKGLGSVQVMGYAKLSYSSAAPTLGITKISADGAGGIKSDANGREVLVLGVDEGSHTAEILL